MQTPEKHLPSELSIDSFDYPLPADRIATFPLQKRDQSKLLVYKSGSLTDGIYNQIDKHLSPDSILVFNKTRVVQARLHFKTNTGATIEIFCLEPEDKQIEVYQSMQQTAKTRWKCLVGGLKKWKEGVVTLQIPDEKEGCLLTAKLQEKEADAFIIEFEWQPSELTFAEVLEKAGKIPLPPYIKREVSEEDKARYQTIYAEHEGSVAAPTAGLHFTPEIFENLKKKNIEFQYLTLHIGAGTFKPVKAQKIGEHTMHSEQIVVEKQFIQQLIKSLDKEIVAVGTTSLRTLESLYWLGLKISLAADSTNEISVGQWDPYTLSPQSSPQQALQAVISFMEERQQEVLLTRTQLMIAPGYEWKIVNVLATNFHQPKSTLIMLVAAFIGEDWRKIYQHALDNEYRFLSYGDGSLLFRK